MFCAGQVGVKVLLPRMAGFTVDGREVEDGSALRWKLRALNRLAYIEWHVDDTARLQALTQSLRPWIRARWMRIGKINAFKNSARKKMLRSVRADAPRAAKDDRGLPEDAAGWDGAIAVVCQEELPLAVR